ncbi:DDB1- and CUL4-associated factor 12, partial [Podila verticillata]
MQCDDDIIIHYDPYASWTFSYSSAVPTVHSGSVLGPLRRRECQTRQQQLRKGTVRRIGIASKPEDRVQARAIAGHGFRANSVNNSHASSGSASPSIEERRNGASGLPPRPASEIYQTSSSTFSPNIMEVETSTSWTSIPSSPPRRMMSPNFSDASSTPSSSSASYDLPARTRSRIESASQRLAQGSSKSFMMVSQAMGFGQNPSASSSDSSSTSPIASATNHDDVFSATSTPSSFTPINSHLSVAQMGGGGRRMSTPSISSPKLSYESSMDSSCSIGSGASLQRPASSLSNSSSARSWTAVDATSTLTSSEENGYYNTTPANSAAVRKAKHQRSCRPSYDPYNSTDIVSDRVPTIISEREYCVEGFDKVFAATWLSPDNVLMGTKCHNLLMLNVHTNKMMRMGRMQDCLLEQPDQLLPRLAVMAAEQEESNLFSKIQGLNMSIPASSSSSNSNNNSNRASTSTSPIIPAPSSPLAGLNGIASSLERGLRFFSSPTRRSSTPSFPSRMNAQGSSSSRSPERPVHTNNNRTPRALHNSTNNPISNTAVTTTTTNTNANPINNNIASASTSAGVRSMSINPSRTLLAIGSGDPYQVTIYSLPELEPVGMMYGHSDLVFALTWISDTVLVSGSRDGSTRVWSTESAVLATLPAVSKSVEVRLSVLTRAEDKTKVRDLAFNKNTGQLMTLTTEGYVKLWDRESYIQISKLKLIHSTETVCLTANSDANLFAVGSQSHISITDPRSSSIVHVAESCDEGWGVRALDFKSHIITTGGGYGRLGFYDLRAQRYLDG